MATSATGGYLTPASNPTSDAALARVMHGLIAGVTGLTASVIRPKWQGNMPVIPVAGVNWCGFSIGNFQAGQAYQVQADNLPDTICQFEQEESFDLDCSFYGADCQRYAAMLRDGVQIAQNREAMYLLSIAIVGGTQIVRAPELINDVWHDRCDITIGMARKTTVNYSVLHFLAADGTITTDSPPLSVDWQSGYPAGVFDLTFDETFG